MIRTILIDFKRTLYDPETHQLYQDWEAIFELRKFGIEVWLWSRDEFSGTERKLRKKIKEKFDKAIISNEKNLDLVRKPMESCILSDHRIDIEMAQKVGAKTIWIRRGKYKDTWPKNEPDFLVYSLYEAVEKIKGFMV